jgi:predicted ribonuclease YlaK
MLESLVDRSVLLVVPFTVMSELDFRSKEGEGTENDGSHGARRKIQTGCAAREARNWISSQIATTDGGVHIQSLQEVDVSRLRACVNNDDKILACASYFKEKVPCADVIVATNDLNLSLKAKAEGFELLSSEDMDPCPEFSNRRTRQLKSRSVPSRRR